MAAVALGVVGAGAAVVAGVRPSGMAALCLCAWGLAEAGAALWERLRQEAAPGAALWGVPRPPSHGLRNDWPDLAWHPNHVPVAWQHCVGAPRARWRLGGAMVPALECQLCRLLMKFACRVLSRGMRFCALAHCFIIACVCIFATGGLALQCNR